MSAMGDNDPTFDPERRNSLPTHIKHWSEKPETLDDATDKEWNQYQGKMKPWTDRGCNGPLTNINKEELKKAWTDSIDAITGESNNDAVNHPSHYTNRSMEAIDIIEMVIGIEKNTKVAYAMSNVLKYMLRFRDKGKPIEDMKKARWYLDRMIKHLEDEDEKVRF